jgi:adenylosuccinate lyase
MIPRYTLPEMDEVWSEEHKQKIWLEVELLALKGMEAEGLIPSGIYESVSRKAVLNPKRAHELEEEVKHDVIAFLTSITEITGPDGRYLHRGMTSNDLLDTAFAVQLKEASTLILSTLQNLIAISVKRAETFKYTPCMGRSHGIHAEPTSFGIKLLSWAAELKRREECIASAVKNVTVGKLAGAVGTFASLPPSIEKRVLEGLGIGVEEVPTQVVQRDRHAEFFTSLALLGSTVERICVEIRHLQRTEVREVEESFSKGQKGSSAMPHKKNPIASENLTGIARMLRGYALPALENVALWHERDISHSSVERIIAPDACILAHYMIKRLSGLIQNLIVYPDTMLSNVNLTLGLVFSGTLLITLTDKGMTREDAYKLVQEKALFCYEKNLPLKDEILKLQEIKKFLSNAEIEEIFALDRHLKHVEYIFERAKKQYNL